MRSSTLPPHAPALQDDDSPVLDAISISRMPPDELQLLLGPERSRKAIGIADWLLRTDRGKQMTEHLVLELCDRLVSAGVPLDRYGSSTAMLSPEHDAIGRIWLRGKGVSERVYIRAETEDPIFLHSPMHYAAETGQWLELWLPETPDDRFGIVPELKQGGYVHYLCVPLTLFNDARGWLTFATRSAAGFSVHDLAVLAWIIPALSARIDTRIAWWTLDKLLRTYVGDEPHQAILAGNVKRGQVTTIRSAMLFADMRNSTGHTADLSVVEAVQVFNDLFDCLVPPIENRRGEVLKYIGDGLLAIFRQATEGACDATNRALEAAEEALHRLDDFNAKHPDKRPIHVGIALHFGEAAYGNVGSGQRLDFTVIGRDVSLASRVAHMNRYLDEPLLLSAAFATRLARPVTRLGTFPARGFTDPIEVFKPA